MTALFVLLARGPARFVLLARGPARFEAQRHQRSGAAEPRSSTRSAWRTLSATLTLVPLLACSTGDTILALNVSSADDVGLIRELRVTIAQEGHAPVEHSLVPPLKDVEDAGQVISSNFFERIKLPASWDEAPVEISVKAVSPNAAALNASATAEIKPGAAVAAYVQLERKPADDADAGEAANASDGSAADADADGGLEDGAADSDARM
jgi:hypothetical protein